MKNTLNLPYFTFIDRWATDPELLNVVTGVKPAVTYFIQPNKTNSAEAIIGGLRMLARSVKFCDQNYPVDGVMDSEQQATVVAQATEARLVTAIAPDGRVVFAVLPRVQGDEIENKAREQFGTMLDELSQSTVADINGATWRRHKNKYGEQAFLVMQRIREGFPSASEICYLSPVGLISYKF